MQMWIFLAAGSAFFAGITAILAKLGIKKTPSNLATAIRTIVVLIFAWIIVWISGGFDDIYTVQWPELLTIIASGLCTGASWLCYFYALQKGSVSQVVPIDKTSVLMVIVLSFILFQEPVTAYTAAGMLLIGAGTWLMLDKKDLNTSEKKKSGSWMLMAFGSAFFAALSSSFGKMGVSEINSNLATAIRTIVVLVFSWVMVFVSRQEKDLHGMDSREILFLILSGLTTGASWLSFYAALQSGPASAVVPIDKLSIVFTMIFSVFVLHEKISIRAWTGLAVQVAGTLLMIL